MDFPDEHLAAAEAERRRRERERAGEAALEGVIVLPTRDPPPVPPADVGQLEQAAAPVTWTAAQRAARAVQVLLEARRNERPSLPVQPSATKRGKTPQ